MYENRWPQPGPGMVAVFAVIGLIGGILVGLFNPSGTQRGPNQNVNDRGGQAASTTVGALPDDFYTVILASIVSSQDRSVAEARATTYRDSGVRGVGVLDSSRYGSLSSHYWVVYSGVFPTWQEAIDRRDQIRETHPGLCGCYAKRVADHS